jgi:hypothetical protein
MLHKGNFYYRVQIKKFRSAVILVFSVLFYYVINSGILPAQISQKQKKELSEVLEKAAHYCEQLEQTPLHFVCTEEVWENVNVPYTKSGGDINHSIDGFFRYLQTQGFVDVTSPAPGSLHYGFSTGGALQVEIGQHFGMELESGYEIFSAKRNIESTGGMF